MTDLFNIVAAIVILQMAVILTMVETDRACKNEPLRIVWGRRAGFGIGGATLIYGGVSGNWQIAFLLAALACCAILTVNIISIRARNQPPLQGHRIIMRSAAFWRRYP